MIHSLNKYLLMLVMCQAPPCVSHKVGLSSKENKFPALVYYSNGKSNLKNKQEYII